MRFQLWQYALLRPATIFPMALGLWASLSRTWVGLGIALMAYGLYQAFKLVNDTPHAEERLFLRKEKKRRGIQRKLNPIEQTLLLKLLSYTRQLERLGGDPSLSHELLNQAWLAIEGNQSMKGNAALEALVHSLPKIQPSGSQPREDLMNRLRKECEIMYASQAEANASSHSHSW